MRDRETRSGAVPVADAASATRRHDGRWIAAIFAVGLALSLLLVMRTQVGEDQLNMLARGWLLVARGEWVPYGNPATTGGAVPGGVTALLVGGPLELWSNHRAPLLLQLLTQVAAFLLLDRLLRETVGERERLLFAVFYWINPWRLMLSGFLWNPGYLLLIGAMHAWSAWRLRSERHFGASMVHALALGLGMQINLSVTLLVMVSGLLFVSGRLRLRWSGVVAAAAVSVVPLVPWLLALGEGAPRLPVGRGFLGRGLIFVFPLVRGITYWLRDVSFQLPGKETRLDFSAVLSPGIAYLPVALRHVIVEGLGYLSLILPLLANIWLLRRWRRRGWRRPFPDSPSRRRGWLLGYLRISLFGSLLVYSLAPTTVIWWDGMSLVHAPILIVVLWSSVMWRRRGRQVIRGVAAWGAVSVTLLLLIAFGGPRHRCGGEGNIVVPLRHDHPMLYDLGIHDSCRVPIEPDGLWLDILPEPASSSAP